MVPYLSAELITELWLVESNHMPLLKKYDYLNGGYTTNTLVMSVHVLYISLEQYTVSL